MITVVENVLGISETEYREIFDRAAQVIQRGGTVAFPTETVYGLGASAISEVAADRIYQAKGRPSDNPLIVHIAEIEYLEKIARGISSDARLLMEHFWPGPLTLIFKKRSIIPDKITGGLDTVAVRMPSNKVAIDLIRYSGLPIAAPSANLSGRPSPTNAYHVLEDLNTRIDMIIDGGSTEFGLESTIVDVSRTNPVLLRPGSVTLEMMNNIVGEVKLPGKINKDAPPMAPGMKYTHYAPKAEVIIVNGSIKDMSDKINELVKADKDIVTGIMATEQTLKFYKDIPNVISVGDRLKPETIGANLFDILRKFDYYKVDRVYAEGYGEDGVGLAIMNRLKKSAGYKIIEV